MAAERTGPIRGRGDRRLRPSDVVAAAATARAGRVDPPIVLAYHQVSPDNPFQTLIYRRAGAHGIAALGIDDLNELDALEATLRSDARTATPAVPALHLHWVNRILRGSRSDAEAADRTAAIAARLAALHDRGWTVVWTVHNVLPHDAERPDAEAALRQVLADGADLVHVMVSTTLELAAPHFRIDPGKVVHVPIPSFRGAYADAIDRDAARYALDLPPDARVVALVGGLRPYKGLDLLLEAFERTASTAPDLRLLIAGPPDGSAGIDAFLARAAADPRIAVHARMIPGDDLQIFLRAADAAVLPYVRTLNSAVLMLALAFDLPVIGPDLGGIPETLGATAGTLDPALATIFAAGDVDALAAALAAVRPASPAGAAAARRVSDAHDADTLSDRLMISVRRAAESRG
ncbi:MAG: glycosyltransferase [Chloroflexi bacterium]|nr:MAG: glycosyltransferase [Chloroflexota bacterium]